MDNEKFTIKESSCKNDFIKLLKILGVDKIKIDTDNKQNEGTLQ